MNQAIAKIYGAIFNLIIKIRASDFGGEPVTVRYNWPSRPVEKLVLALPLLFYVQLGSFFLLCEDRQLHQLWINYYNVKITKANSTHL